MRVGSIALFAAVLMCGVAARAAAPVRYGTDLNGTAVGSLMDPDSRAVVLVFFASDCPISNRYVPEVERLAREFAAQRIRFWVVYPNPGETRKTVVAQRSAFHETVSALLDPGQSLVRLAGVTTTPEAAVLVPSGDGLREVYRGRIDDRYIDFGHQRPQATRRELEAALKAVVVGGVVPRAAGHPVGCSIVPLSTR